MIIDFHKKVIERYDPHGHVINTRVDKLVIQLIEESKLTDFNYIPPFIVTESPSKIGYTGLQSIQSEIKDPLYTDYGYCQKWCFFYLFLRLSQPETPSNILMKNVVVDLYSSMNVNRVSKYIYDTVQNFTKLLHTFVQLYVNMHTYFVKQNTSIKFNEKLKYRTLGGRVVYGGGGITPDVFVARDTLYFTKYLSDLIGKNM